MARSFTTGDLISCANSASLNPVTGGNNQFTISIWFRQTGSTVASAYSNIVGQVTTPNTGSNYNIDVGGQGANADRLAWYFNNSTCGVDPGSHTMTANTWFHLLATYDSTVARLSTFVNGASDGTVTHAAGAITWGSAATRFNPGTAGSTVLLADFALWNVILTAGEITALSKGARPGFIRPTAVGAWLPFDGLVSPEIDLSGNKNSGTLTGTSRAATAPPIMMFTPRWPRFLDAVAAGAAHSSQRRLLVGAGV